MGLDVYLYSRAQHEHNEKYEATYEMDDQEAAKAVRTELDGYSLGEDVPSRAYPDHLFNRRYLRSSYNSSGFDRVVPMLLGDDSASLDGLFEKVHEPDGYDTVLTADHIPGLREAASRALSIASMLAACDPLLVDSTGPLLGAAEHLWDEPPTEGEVLRWAREELAKSPSSDIGPGFSAYETAKGLIQRDGLEVVALTAGRSRFRGEVAIYVYRMSPEGLRSYVQSAEIIAEFCEEAIMLIERDGSCALSWSG